MCMTGKDFNLYSFGLATPEGTAWALLSISTPRRFSSEDCFGMNISCVPPHEKVRYGRCDVVKLSTSYKLYTPRNFSS